MPTSDDHKGPGDRRYDVLDVIDLLAQLSAGETSDHRDAEIEKAREYLRYHRSSFATRDLIVAIHHTTHAHHGHLVRALEAQTKAEKAIAEEARLRADALRLGMVREEGQWEAIKTFATPKNLGIVGLLILVIIMGAEDAVSLIKAWKGQ